MISAIFAVSCLLFFLDVVMTFNFIITLIKINDKHKNNEIGVN